MTQQAHAFHGSTHASPLHRATSVKPSCHHVCIAELRIPAIVHTYLLFIKLRFNFLSLFPLHTSSRATTSSTVKLYSLHRPRFSGLFNRVIASSVDTISTKLTKMHFTSSLTALAATAIITMVSAQAPTSISSIQDITIDFNSFKPGVSYASADHKSIVSLLYSPVFLPTSPILLTKEKSLQKQYA